MKKVISITLGTVVYSIEEDAYEKLKLYLDTVAAHFGGTEDGDEIVEDIENSISEKFFEKGKSDKKAVTKEDVKTVIKEMGTVQDFVQSGTGEPMANTEKGSEDSKQSRRMYRNPDDKILGGVASGIAAYSGLDVLVIRIAFIVLTFLTGVGLVVYLVLWFLIPEAQSASQKLEMRGEPVTIASLKDNVVNEFESLKKKNFGTFRKIISVPVDIVRAVAVSVGNIFGFIIPFVRIILGLIFVFAGAVAIVATVAAFAGLLSGGGFWMFSPVDQSILLQIFDGSWQGNMLIGSIAVLALTPLLVMLIGGASLVRNKNSFRLAGTLSLFLVWVSALGAIVFLGGNHYPMVTEQVKMTQHSDNAVLAGEERVYDELATFDRVVLKGGSYTFHIVQGEKERVVVHSDDQTLQNLSVTSHKDTLTIQHLGGHRVCIFGCYSFKNIHIEITSPHFKQLVAGGSSQGIIEDFDSEELSIDSSGSLKVIARVTGKNAEVNSSGSSHVILSGSSDNLSLDLSGSSQIHAYDLEVLNAEVDVSGSATVRLRVEESLSTHLSGYGKVTYVGDPTLSEKISGYGDVTRAEGVVESDSSLNYLYDRFAVEESFE